MPTELEFLLRVFVAMLLGGAIGFDRQHRNKPAGVRTHMLVAGGSALFVAGAFLILGEASTVAARGDVVRVPAAIIAGIGFLGAGAILRSGPRVTGLTTAAGIWVTAAVGILVGAGFWLIAVGGTALALLAVNIFSIVPGPGDDESDSSVSEVS